MSDSYITKIMYNILITSVVEPSSIFNKKIKNGKFKDLRITELIKTKIVALNIFFDNFVVTPSGKSTTYKNKIKRIIKKYNINL